METNQKQFLSIYRALDHDLKNDFFMPLLNNAIYYLAATGFFTLSGLAELIESIIPILKRGGKVSILTSPLLQQEDVDKIEKSEFDKEYIESIILKEIDNLNIYGKNIELELKLLAALINENIINLKIIYSKKGIFHEKTGYVENIFGERFAYNGSANLTYSGLYSNIESITVFIEERDDRSIKETKEYLDRLLNEEYGTTKVMDIKDSIREKLLTFQDNSESIDSLIKKVEKKTESVLQLNGIFEVREENEVLLRDYQEKAINQFIENNFIHFFEMATGTGKTYTALFALQQLQKKIKGPLFTIVILPWIDLMFQWSESAAKSKIAGSIYRIGGGAHIGSASSVFDKALTKFINGESVTIFIVSKSYQLYSREFLERYWINIKESLFIIVDEAHNITESIYSGLPKAKYRLGLSATPQRVDIKETENILSYFRGEIYKETFKYGLKEAIENNYLSKYYYYPIFVHLTSEEHEKYEKETITIAIYLDYKTPEEKEKLERALQRRSLIVKKASGKMVKLRQMLNSEEYDFKSSVIYCGPGNVDEDLRMTDYVTKMVHKIGKYDVTKFVAETEDREKILKSFASGYYDTMVAIKCFDEGIDVPSLNRIYILSSDNNYRQTVQRRGRVLRVSKETGKEYADIFDFIVLPPPGVPFKSVQALIKNEMARFIEYASLSENYKDQSYIIQSTIEDAELELEEVKYD